MSIQRVIEKLGQMNDIHSILLELAKEKKQVLIDNNVEQLSRIMIKETKLAKMITECEQEWRQAAGLFMQEKGFRATPSMSISDLAKWVLQVDERKALLDARSILVETVEELKIVNELNQQLIKQSLQFIDYSLDLFAGASEPEVTYQNPAQQILGSTRSGLFDTKA